MRAAAVLLVLALVALPAAEAGWSRMAVHTGAGPGWWADSFQLVDSSRIHVTFAASSKGEVTGHMVMLYDGAEAFLGGLSFFTVGGQLVEVTSQDSIATLTTTGSQDAAIVGGSFQRTIYITCDATCNPSRTFTLVVTSGGAQEGWAYAIQTQGATRLGDIGGSTAFAFTTREFQGDVKHVGTPLGGIHAVEDGTYAAVASGKALVSFLKPSTAAPRTMAIDTPTGTVACECFAGSWPAGDYTFRYEDLDVTGTEGYLTFADVRFP